MVVLKRLEDAIADGDHIYATIAGIGLSNDIGGNLMLPDSEGQVRAMREAYRQAGWSPRDIDLVECHGTGTPTGDAVEFASLSQLWSTAEPPNRASGEKCVLGSVKSNVGHLLTAAGAAGLDQSAVGDAKQPAAADGAFCSIRRQDRPGIEPVSSARAAWGMVAASGRRAAPRGDQRIRVRRDQLRICCWKNGCLPKTNRGRFPHGLGRTKGRRSRLSALNAACGPWRSLAGLRRGLFEESSQPARRSVRSQSTKSKFPVGRFRIPPSELADMLPQQLLMLQVAANAWEDFAGGPLADQPRVRTGVFIGIGLDLNTTNFHVRWNMANHARAWAERLGLSADDDAVRAWTAALRDSASPPLTANRTMGALGGIVASRIARALRVGGPSFTISSEETSGVRALKVAVGALRRGELDTAVVGRSISRRTLAQSRPSARLTSRRRDSPPTG